MRDGPARQAAAPNPFWALRLVAAILNDHPAIAAAVPADAGLTPAVDVITHDGAQFRLVVDVGDRREEIERLFALPRPASPPRRCGTAHAGDCTSEPPYTTGGPR